MITWLSTITYLLFIGLGVGGMFISKRLMPNKIHLYLLAICFGFATYFGMVLGNWIFAIFSIRMMEITMAIHVLGFVALAFMKHHLTYGYFYQENKQLFLFLLSIFFLLGVEWAILDLTYSFVIFSTLLFSGFLFIGLMLQFIVFQRAWRLPVAALTPLVWFVLYSILKLL